MNLKKIHTTLLTFVCYGLAISQGISFENFIDKVKSNHPYIERNQLEEEKSYANLQSTRGAFDPVLHFSYSEKEFQKKNYYEILQTGIEAKTRTGVTFFGEFNQTNGEYLSNQLYTPDNGNIAAGVKVPIGYGMFTDETRTNLRVAQNYIQIIQNEVKLNKVELIFHASDAYYNWAHMFQKLNLYKDFVDLSKNRHQLVVKSFVQGDKPAIDTLDSYSQFLKRKIDLNAIEIEYFLAKYTVSSYLWDNDKNPVFLNDSAYPSMLVATKLPEAPTQYKHLIDNIKNHPYLQKIEFKNQELELTQRLKREKLKPKLDLKYNLINEPMNSDAKNEIGPSNYALGIDFKFPIFLRDARNQLKVNRIKMQQNELDFQQKAQEINMKSNAYYFQLEKLFELTSSIEVVTNNYQQLLDAEKTKFFNGESSIFLINSRENKLLETKEKQLEYLIKYYKSINKLEYSVGIWRE